jgi:cysteine desulfurase / selenocysteine lyase
MLDEASRSAVFPTLEGRVYLNTAAEGIPPLPVREALAQYFDDHQRGMDGRDAHFAQWHALRGLVGRALGLSAEEIGICSCSSEAYNLIALAMDLMPGDEVVVNDLDFPAGVTPFLQDACPATVRVWRARDGALRCEDLEPLLSDRTRLVTVSLVSYYNGFCLPLGAVTDLVHRRSPAALAVDVTQALGRIPLNLGAADVVVSSTHKWMLGSHGGGLVGVRDGGRADWTVQAGGWLNVENAFAPDRFERAVSKRGAAGFGAGMPNFPAIYANRAALAYVLEVDPAAIDRAARPLVRHCQAELKKLPVELITPDEETALAGILAFRHPRGEALHRRLHAANVHVMAQAGRLRVAIHGYNTLSDIETFLTALREALEDETR